MLFGCKRPCAYCRLHHFTMSVKQVKIKKCISKGCHYLKKCDHEYWKMRDDKRQDKKERKKQFDEWYESVCKGGNANAKTV